MFSTSIEPLSENLAISRSVNSVSSQRYSYHYVKYERRPIEVLIFSMDPTHVQEFLDVDHDVWTLGEAFEFPRAVDSNLHTKSNESQNVPNENMHFLSKEVWLDDNNPGLVTMHFVWKNRDSWMHVSTPSFQVALQDAFAKRFRHPYTVLRIDTLENSAIHRYSRFDCDMQLKAYEKSI